VQVNARIDSGKGFLFFVIPAKAGIQLKKEPLRRIRALLDACLRGHDKIHEMSHITSSASHAKIIPHYS
jgi:hypothetical protein